MMKFLSIKNVDAFYGSIQALKDVSFEVDEVLFTQE